VNISSGRILTLFFAACFLGMQLCQIHQISPVKQHSPIFYAVELNDTSWGLSDISTPTYPEQLTHTKHKLVSQKAQISKQKQYQKGIEQQVHWPFVYPKQQSLNIELFAIKQVVSLKVQQQLQLFIHVIPNLSIRLFKPEPNEFLSNLSLN
jgi:hypothetical protein